jgi:hypothetical protein
MPDTRWTLTYGYGLRRTRWTHCIDLRIRRLGVRVPPSAPRSTALSPISGAPFANGFANNGTITGRNRAGEDVRRLSDLIPDQVRVDPQGYQVYITPAQVEQLAAAGTGVRSQVKKANRR